MKTAYRRDFLKFLGLSTLGAAGACTASTITPPPLPPNPTITVAPPTSQPTAESQPPPQKNRVLRIAHMTDFHVRPEDPAPAGMAAALRHAQAQSDPPDMILNTGDCVMDSLENDKARVEQLWDTYKTILAAECQLPIVHTLGNHDVWGWGLNDASITKDPLYGKQMALENLGLTNRYYSFDRAGWHFVVLDSTHVRNEVSTYPYIGRLDDEQFSWFSEDIKTIAASGGTPVCIVSHIPIMAGCEYFDGPNEESGNWIIPAAWVHIDARRFRDLFVQNPCIRLCLSGHTHQYESLDYLGVRYVTSGAVCGNWWNGVYLDFPPAYVMINLYDDGSADSTFVPYSES